MNTAASVIIEPVTTSPVQTNPFPGLRPFREDEEYLFFGRENQVDAMVNKLANTRFLAVVGTSGSGKSSLVNCGLRPALHGGLMARAGTAWRMAQFRPGSDPMRAMARALAKDGVLFRDYQADGLSLAEIVDTTLRMSKLGLIDIYEQANLGEDINLLVVVDQFEELFRYRQLGAGQQENVYGVSEAAAAFVNLLLEAKAQTTYPIYVVLTMRSDFLGDCTQFPGLAEAINTGQYLVPRMTRDERRAAIGGPVGVGGAEISPVLLTRLVNDVGDNPDQLSILQHALNRTWARWQNEGGGKGPLDLTHYEAIGTMAHALDQHAERAYAELGTTLQQQICEQLFKALTDKATDSRGIRRPTTLGNLCALADATAAEVTAVIDVFRKPSRSFLMPPAGEALETETVIDISHESLMRVWQRLNTWADEEAQSAQMYRRLADAAGRHAVGKASLWREPDLQLALDWRDQSQPNETWASRYHPGFAAAMGFLTQSSEAREAERERLEQQRRREVEAEQEKAKAQSQARNARRMRLAAMVCIAFAAVAIYMWLDARTAAREAIVDRNRAMNAEAEARVLRAAAEKEAKEETGLRKTAEDAKTEATAAATEAEKQALLALGGRVAAQSILFADPSINVPLDTAALLAIASYQLQPTFEARRGLLAPMSRLAQVSKILASPTAPNGVAFSPDGKTIISAGDDGSLLLWDVETGRRRGQPVRAHADRAWTVAVSPDGSAIVSGAKDGTLVFWDARTGRPTKGPIQAHDKWINKVAFSRDGKTIVSASDDRTLIFWDTSTQSSRGRVSAQDEGDANTFAFTADGKAVVSGHSEGAIIIWDAEEHRKLDVVQQKRGNAVFSIAVSPDGRQIVSGHQNGAVVFWTQAGDGKFREAKATREHRDWVYSLAFSPDGSKLVSASKDNTIVVWDASQRAPVGDRGNSSNAVLRAHKNEVRSVAFSPDGRSFVSASLDNSLILWSIDASITMGYMVDAHTSALQSLAFSPDGKTVVSGGQDGTLKIWNAATRKALAPDGPSRENDGVLSVAFSPDGKLIASGHKSGALKLSDGATLTSVLSESPVAHKNGTLSVAFSPDGKTLVSGGEDKKLRSWNPATLRPRPSEPASGHDGPVGTIAFNTDGKSVASAGDDLIVRFWAAPGLKRIGETLRKHDRKVNAVAYDPTGRILASASNDGTVVLWDVGTRRALGEPLRGHRGASQSDGVTTLSFSRDGRMLASGATDKTLILWDVETRLPLEPLRGHLAEVLAVAFSPDGRTLVSGDSRGDLFFWEVDPESWRSKLCAKLSRNLSQSEWDTYVGKSVPYKEQCPRLPKSGT